MTDNQIGHIQELLKINRDNLQRLEKQIAQHGGEMSAPLRLLSQRDDILAEIERLENELRQLRQRVASASLPEASMSERSGGETPVQADLAALHQKLNRYFNKEELRTLCFDLGIDYDSLRGEGKAAKARELVQHCERHGLTAKLIKACAQLRPHVSW
jgi:chromosome segregation ATPase